MKRRSRHGTFDLAILAPLLLGGFAWFATTACSPRELAAGSGGLIKVKELPNEDVNGTQVYWKGLKYEGGSRKTTRFGGTGGDLECDEGRYKSGGEQGLDVAATRANLQGLVNSYQGGKDEIEACARTTIVSENEMRRRYGCDYDKLLQLTPPGHLHRPPDHPDSLLLVAIEPLCVAASNAYLEQPCANMDIDRSRRQNPGWLNRAISTLQEFNSCVAEFQQAALKRQQPTPQQRDKMDPAMSGAIMQGVLGAGMGAASGPRPPSQLQQQTQPRQPAPTTQPAPAMQPTPAAQPAPMMQPAPAAQPTPVMQPAPKMQPTPPPPPPPAPAKVIRPAVKTAPMDDVR